MRRLIRGHPHEPQGRCASDELLSDPLLNVQLTGKSEDTDTKSASSFQNVSHLC